MNENDTADAGDRTSSSWLAPSRRLVIKAAAAIGVAGGFSGQTTAQDDGTDVANRFELEGETGGWVGVAPEEIAEDQNPTLLLEPGEDYEVFWENTDGASHNFAIENEEDEVFFATDFVSSIGETQEVSFTAREEYDHYVCQPHRKTMRGRIVFDEAELDQDGESDQTEEEGTTTEEEPAAVPTSSFTLSLHDGHWRGESPDEISGETNPTLNVEAGETYAISWTLRTEREDHQTGHNLVIHDEDGRHLTYTDFASEEGQGRTLVFTADEEMAYYSDQTQLGVRGELEVSEASTEQTTTESEGGNDSGG